MRWALPLCFLLFSSCITIYGLRTKKDGIAFFSSENGAFRYIGRFDTITAGHPRCWAPGSYIEVGFNGTFCEIEITDEARFGYHNYIEVVIDDLPPQRIRLKAEKNVILVSDKLPPGSHTLVICKDTEASIGYIEFSGISCTSVFPVPARKKKIEFIGDSITCGNGCDDSQTTCGEGQWFDQHNAWLSFGPSVARMLDADWQLCAVSGIGLTRSCCGSEVTMPAVYDRLDLSKDGPVWQFGSSDPDLVVITLGQNDGLQDSTTFCETYVQFIAGLRNRYEAAKIICCTSPMASAELKPVMKRYVESIAMVVRTNGDEGVYAFSYDGMYRSGCTFHPTAFEHEAITRELAPYVRRIMQW